MLLHCLLLTFGFIGGAVCLWVLLEPRARRAQENQAAADAAREELDRGRQSLEAKRALLDRQSSDRTLELAECRRQDEENLQVQRARLDAEAAQLERLRKEANDRTVTYAELQNENTLLKRDLRNVEIAVRKLKLDRDALESRQQKLDERSRDLASRYLKESVRSISSSLGTNNHTACRQRLRDVIERCREIGFLIPATEEEQLLADLKAGFERAVRVELDHDARGRDAARARE